MENRLLRTERCVRHQDYRLGVALSGGGARGLAHVGALKAIEEAGLHIDVIAGVSAGSIVAAMYSAGLKAETILEIFAEAKFFDFAELTLGSGGLIRIDRFINFMTRCLGKYRNIEDLPIPTYIGVTNLDEGTPEVFSAGDIGTIVKASCSIPIAIPPVFINDTCYVDGGVLRNLPAWAIRDKCDKLIGISVSPLLPKKTNPTLLSMALRSYTLLARSNQDQDLRMCDLALSLDGISSHGVFNLNELETVYNDGYENMKQALLTTNY